MLCGFFASVPASPSSPSSPLLSESAPTPPSSSSLTPSACVPFPPRTLRSWGRSESQTATGAPASSPASIPSSPLPCGSRSASARKASPKLPLGPADDQPGCGVSGADISYAFWQRNFAGDPSVIGKRLTLDGNSFQVIGVTPPGFNGISIGDTFDVAVPICVEPILSPRNNRLTRRHSWWLATIGRLKPGWTIARANAQILAVTPAILQETIPTVYDAEATKKYLEYKLGAFSASTGFSELRSDSETSLWLLLGISGLVLLIACANLANLMLARASARERQITIRRALGATRWRMVRELLSESLLLAAAGSTCGLFLAFAISRMLVTFISTEQNQIFLDLGMDWRVLAFTTGVAAVTTVSFGLAPALRATRAEPAMLLQSGSRGATVGRERFSLRRILIVSQVGLSVVLLMGALLFVRSLRNLTTLNVGDAQCRTVRRVASAVGRAPLRSSLSTSTCAQHDRHKVQTLQRRTES